MEKRTRRALGVATMLAGVGLIGWAFCAPVLDVIDYFDLAETWNATCPSRLIGHVYLVCGLIVLVLGQRLFTGRKLHTGERPE